MQQFLVPKRMIKSKVGLRTFIVIYVNSLSRARVTVLFAAVKL
jgi:hypothetical protein